MAHVSESEGPNEDLFIENSENIAQNQCRKTRNKLEIGKKT
jgi:hypothetical protein